VSYLNFERQQSTSIAVGIANGMMVSCNKLRSGFDNVGSVTGTFYPPVASPHDQSLHYSPQTQAQQPKSYGAMQQQQQQQQQQQCKTAGTRAYSARIGSNSNNSNSNNRTWDCVPPRAAPVSRLYFVMIMTVINLFVRGSFFTLWQLMRASWDFLLLCGYKDLGPALRIN
jgi:hypothetical protein